MRSICFILFMTVSQVVLAQQPPAKEKVCLPDSVRGNWEPRHQGENEEYQLAATTMRRFLREEGKLRKVQPVPNLSKHKPARRTVRFTYSTTIDRKCLDKRCAVVKRRFKTEWVHKNNLVHHKRLRRTKYVHFNDMWDFKARMFLVGRNVKELYAFKDEGPKPDSLKHDYKVLAFGRALPFLPRGIVVVNKRESLALRNFAPILTEIRKYEGKGYYGRKTKLVRMNTWTRYDLYEKN